MRKKQTSSYPTKTSLNLVIREKSLESPSRILPIAAGVLILLVGFGKFAVWDRLSRVSQEQDNLDTLLSQVSQLTEKTAGYSELLAVYSQYTTSWMSQEEILLVDQADILSLVQTQLMPSASVSRFSVSGNVVSVELSQITLQGVSGLVQKLGALPQVLEVNVYTASSQTQNEPISSVSLSITLTAGYPGESGQEGSGE